MHNRLSQTDDDCLEETHIFYLNNLIYQGESQFQKILIADHLYYGRMLFLDDLLQSAENDEFIYHESLVHPGMIAHGSPKSVLVIGGGEGATIREVLRYPSVTQLTMIDIDETLVELCKKYLPTWHDGAFKDPRVKLIIQDGIKYIENCKEKFDIIIIDVNDDFDDELGELYCNDFYEKLNKKLNSNGFLITQANNFCEIDNEVHIKIFKELKKVFKYVDSYTSHIPSFRSSWGYLIASNNSSSSMKPEEVDRELEKRKVNHQLKYYDGITHQQMFSYSKFLRKKMQ